MGKYYYLISGLPNLNIEDNKLPFSSQSFREILDEYLSSSDKAKVDLIFLEKDNKNLLFALRGESEREFEDGNYSKGDILRLTSALRSRDEEDTTSIKKKFAPYILHFLESYRAEDMEIDCFAEDQLASVYYEYAMKKGGKFLKGWFEFNLNMRNILTALTVRKYNLDKKAYIVGNNHIAKLLTRASGRDIGLTDEYEYLSEIVKISEEKDIFNREKRIDKLKWNWLEDQTFFELFSIDILLAYLLKLQILERWNKLDKDKGETTFRFLVKDLKKDSHSSLESFKRNNNK